MKNYSELPQLLEHSYSPDPVKQKQASDDLVSLRKSQGYLGALRDVMGGGCHDYVKLAASIQFKAVIREHWVIDNDCNPVSPEERQMIKQSLLDMTLTSAPQVKKQLRECIVEIGKHDFPLQWESLLPSIVERSQSLEHIVDALKVVHSVTKRYRNQFKTDETLIELKVILEAFQGPLLEIAMKMNQFVSEMQQDADKLVYGFKALVLISRIFLSLNFVDLPEFFEDHIGEWMNIFLHYLKYETTEERLLEHDNDEDKPGLLHRLQAEICACLGLYADKYDVELAPFLETFAQAIWQLLTKVNQERKFDSVASQAISFLSIASRGVNHKLFNNEAAMTGICQQIIVPNMFFTKADEEDFQENPIEYIRRDIEGSDSDTRRRSSFFFVKGLRKHFEAQVTNILASNITERLGQYAANPAENWREKDVCTYLVSALAVTNQTSADGATATNSLVPIMDYFQTHILPDLQSFPEGNPVLQADALKFATTFRLIIPLDFYPPLLECFAKMLTSSSYVVNTYAAVAIEKFITARNPDKSFRVGDKYKDCVPLILKNSFEILKRKQKTGLDHHACNENEYTMKCIMRILSKLKQEVVPFYQLVIQELSIILAEVAKNPQNPMFSHFLFESIAAVVKNVGSSDPSKVSSFQDLLLPSFQHVLTQDVAEYSPYVFQMMSLMLEMSTDVSPAYHAIFPQLLSPGLWERTANIPGVVRLLQAYVQNLKGSPEVLKFLEGILGIFQRLIGSKQHDHEGFYLLETIVQHLPLEAFQQYLPTIWNLIFIRLTKSKTGKFMRVFTIFMALFCANHSPDFVISSIDSVSKENPKLFAMVLGNVWLENVHNVDGQLERKICCVGMTRLLQSPQLIEKYFDLWAPTLCATLKVILGDKEDAREADDIEEEIGYKASFTRLSHGKKEDVDPFPQLQKATFFAESVHNFSKQHPGKLSPVVQQSMPGPAQEALNNLFAQANTPRPFLV